MIYRCSQQVRNIFDMSTKFLDQVSRSGAFNHLIRRKAAMEDTGLEAIKDLSPLLTDLPLTSTGVFGQGLEQTLKERTEKSKN